MNLYTKESGSGQPMVLLHGNGEDSSYFVNQLSFFESKYHRDCGGHPWTWQISAWLWDIYTWNGLLMI